MDAISEHSFKVDLDGDEPLKPLSYVTKKKQGNRSDRVQLPDAYPKFEIEFFDVIKSCAEYIDKISDRDTRTKYHKQLSKIFVIRHKASAMILFKELVTIQLQKGGDYRGQNSEKSS